jgi:hypothetical protein
LVPGFSLALNPGYRLRFARNTRHCEERSDEAIQKPQGSLDCFASLAMTVIRCAHPGDAAIRIPPRR